MARRRGGKLVKRAHSAGGVVFRQTAPGPEVLLLQHQGGKWMLPKGTIEPGETPEGVARREVLEEAGIGNLTVVADLGEERYFFFWRSEDTYYDKTVHYFLMEFTGSEDPHPQTEEGFIACEWVPLDEASGRIKYKETREIIRRAREVLNSGTLTAHG
ncbi:MAG TPA: NUDIX hydrolase [bacterium]|jgi:8-oxo-dGTP pyrophosphatase MutT (NUDIX family)|nr:NUDIX hydrolase [bacterium]